MFYLSTKDKCIIALVILFGLCYFSYLLGQASKTTSSKPPAQQVTQEIPKDTRLGISAEVFIPNFNAYSSKHQILVYQHVYDDYIEFGNNIYAVIIVGKGNTDNLDSIGVIFPKRDEQALSNGKASICATIYAVSPTTTEDGRRLILEYLGLRENINYASGIKVFDYNGKRYSVNYDGDYVSFIAMAIPPQ